MEVQSQEERLQKEILAEAKTRADRIVARATSAASAAKARAEEEDAELRERTLEQCRKESAQKARNIVQGIWMEERKMWLRKREECLRAFFRSVLQEAQGLAPDDRDREKSLRILAMEAMEALETDLFQAWVSPADVAKVTPQWLESLAGRPLKVTVNSDATIGGGIRIATADGQRVYDNTYAARLRRLDEEFRQELAGCDK